MNKRLLIFTVLCFCLASTYAQSIKIVKATLDRQLVGEYLGKAEILGRIDIALEIENPTKDTLYLMKREISDFMDAKPLIISKSQPPISSEDKECGGSFIDIPSPPSAYRYEEFDREYDAIVVTPKSKRIYNLNEKVANGLCAEGGKLIEVFITYKFLIKNFDISIYNQKIAEGEVAVQLLKQSKLLFEKDKLVATQSELVKQLTNSIEKLSWRGESAANRITEYERFNKLPFYTREMKSNTVTLNK